MYFGSIKDAAENYENTPEKILLLYNSFSESMAQDDLLTRHRLYVEENNLGYGDRCFHWLWKLLVDEMPNSFSFLEIGVFKGQTISLLPMLARQANKEAKIYGVTPLIGAGDKYGKYDDCDYRAEIGAFEDWCETDRHDRCKLIEGFSTDNNIKKECRDIAPFNAVYIDGCHDYEVVANDIVTYSEMVSSKGLLIMDDASTELNLPEGIWPGHPDVGRAVREILLPLGQFEELFAIGHLRVFRNRL